MLRECGTDRSDALLSRCHDERCSPSYRRTMPLARPARSNRLCTARVAEVGGRFRGEGRARTRDRARAAARSGLDPPRQSARPPVIRGRSGCSRRPSRRRAPLLITPLTSPARGMPLMPTTTGMKAPRRHIRWIVSDTMSPAVAVDRVHDLGGRRGPRASGAKLSTRNVTTIAPATVGDALSRSQPSGRNRSRATRVPPSAASRTRLTVPACSGEPE